jgi:hypothetical protein
MLNSNNLHVVLGFIFLGFFVKQLFLYLSNKSKYNSYLESDRLKYKAYHDSIKTLSESETLSDDEKIKFSKSIIYQLGDKRSSNNQKANVG